MAASLPKVMRKQLLSTSVYPVNNSSSKYLLVGYDLVNKVLQPVVKLCGTKGPGPVLQLEAWRKLCDSFETLSDYLDGSSGKVSPIILNQKQIVLFVTYYSQRSIQIDNIQEEDESGEPASKKQKASYSNGIVLQSASIKGLIKASEAVNYKLEDLVNNKEAANYCFGSLISFMETEALGESQSPDGKMKLDYAAANLEKSLSSGFETYCKVVYDKVKDTHPNFGEYKCMALTAELLCYCYDFLYDIVTKDE